MTYFISDETRKSIQSMLKIAEKNQFLIQNSLEQQKLMLSIKKEADETLIRMEPIFKDFAKISEVYLQPLTNLNEMLESSGIAKLINQISEQIKITDVTKINLSPLIEVIENESFEFVGEEIPVESKIELDKALEESGLATSSEPNEEEINAFIRMLQNTLTHSTTKEIGVTIVVNIIMPVIFLVFMQMGLDLQSVSDQLPDLIIVPISKNDRTKEED